MTAPRSTVALRSQEVQALTRHWFVMLRRDRLSVALSIAQPALWMVFFGSAIGRTVDLSVIGVQDYLSFTLPGVIVFTIVGNGVAGALPLLWDKETGYLDKLMTLPVARSSILVSRILAQIAVGTAQVVTIMLIATLLGAYIGFAGVAAILVVTALLTVAATSAALALAYALAAHETFFAVTGFVTIPLTFLSTAFVPASAMGPWMATLVTINPISSAVGAMRGAMTGDGAATAAGLVVTATVAGICLAAAVAVYHRRTGERG